MNVLRNSLTALPGRFDPDTGNGGITATTAPESVEPEQNSEPEQGTNPIVTAPTDINPGTYGPDTNPGDDDNHTDNDTDGSSEGGQAAAA